MSRVAVDMASVRLAISPTEHADLLQTADDAGIPPDDVARLAMLLGLRMLRTLRCSKVVEDRGVYQDRYKTRRMLGLACGHAKTDPGDPYGPLPALLPCKQCSLAQGRCEAAPQASCSPMTLANEPTIGATGRCTTYAVTR